LIPTETEPERQPEREISVAVYSRKKYTGLAHPYLSELPSWLSRGLDSEIADQQHLLDQDNQLAQLPESTEATVSKSLTEDGSSDLPNWLDQENPIPAWSADTTDFARQELAELRSVLPGWLREQPSAEYLAGLPSWLNLRPAPELVASFSRVKVGPRQLFGEGLMTVGTTMVLFLFWYLFLNDAIQSGTQREAASGLSKSWSDFIPLPGISPSVPTSSPTDIEPPRINPGAEGQVFALLYVPRFGDDYVRKIGEGIDLDRVLNSRTIGVGRYPQSDALGAYGNFAIAGHRNTWGAAFGEIGELRLGDRIYVEVKQGWYSYQFRNLEYVWSTEADVLYAFPRITDQPADSRIITLTSCHPKFSEAERIIAYGVYEGWYPRENGPPQEIAELVKGTS
jgi:sortase A